MRDKHARRPTFHNLLLASPWHSDAEQYASDTTHCVVEVNVCFCRKRVCRLSEVVQRSTNVRDLERD